MKIKVEMSASVSGDTVTLSPTKAALQAPGVPVATVVITTTKAPVAFFTTGLVYNVEIERK